MKPGDFVGKDVIALWKMIGFSDQEIERRAKAAGERKKQATAKRAESRKNIKEIPPYVSTDKDVKAFKMLLKRGYDKYYRYSDDPKIFRAGQQHVDAVSFSYSRLSPEHKKAVRPDLKRAGFL